MHSDALVREELAVGWLRSLMDAAEPPVRSFGTLAREVLKAPTWPDATRPQPRSLAALFSKLDRRQELDWLADRPEVQRALASALACPLGSVTAVLEPRAQVVQELGTLRLSEVPYAQPLDLVREPLCPGFPPEVTLPGVWSRTWWYAPAGAGRNLVEAWLRARGACHVVHADEWASGLAKLPSQGATLLSLDRVDHADLRSIRDDVCIAAPCLPQGEGSSAWYVVRSPEPSDYLDELVGWLARRLPDDDHFDPETCRRWLRAGPLQEGALDSLETLLGLCSVADEIGIRRIEHQSIDGVAASYFAHRLGHAHSADNAAVAWLRRAGLGVMIGIVARLLLDRERSIDHPRSFDDWLAVVPVEHQRGGDLEWMKLALSSADSPVRPRDIARAAARMPPGSFRVVQALEQAQLLKRTDGHALSLAPRWFACALQRSARRQLLDSSPLEWGEALLNPREAPELLSHLIERALELDYTPIEAALELDTEDDPASVAAVEASFVAAGMAVLAGLDVPQELLETLWDEQLGLLVELDGALPRTRLLFADTSGDNARADGWFVPGTLHLAALAISEQLPHGVGKRHRLLRPWSETEPSPLLLELYDSLEGVLRGSHMTQGSKQAAVAVVDRMRQTLGQREERLHILERPGAILDEIEHEVLDFDSVKHLDALPGGIGTLKALAEQRGMPWSKVGQAVWHAWNQAARPETGAAFLAPEHAGADLLWSTIPQSLLEELLTDARASGVPFSAFGAEQWSAFLHVAERLDAAVEREWFTRVFPWRVMPREVARECIERTNVAAHCAAAAELWQRFPELVLERMQQDLALGNVTGALLWADSAPLGQTRDLLDLLRERLRILELGRAPMDQLRRWLLKRTAARTSGWREAYAFLCAVEEALAPLPLAR